MHVLIFYEQMATLWGFYAQLMDKWNIENDKGQFFEYTITKLSSEKTKSEDSYYKLLQEY